MQNNEIEDIVSGMRVVGVDVFTEVPDDEPTKDTNTTTNSTTQATEL